MPSIKLALERGEPKRLELAWGAFWRNFVVRLDGAEIGRIAGQKELKAGQEFTLGDGSVLRVQLANSGITPELRVLRNGQPLPGSASDPMSLVRQAAQVLFFIGGISILIGLLAELFHWEQMRAMGAGYFTAIFGIIYLGLGYLVLQRSLPALVAGLALFAVDTLAWIGIAASGSGQPTAGMFMRICLFIGLVRGLGALRTLKKEEMAAEEVLAGV
jgi:hypothetical protein